MTENIYILNDLKYMLNDRKYILNGRFSSRREICRSKIKGEQNFRVKTRVARWLIFKTKIPIWVYLENVGTFYDHLEYFTASW
jgi:hypothetical protein